MLCNWNTSALWGSFSHYIHLLENDGVYLRAIDLKAAGMLYGQVKSWYKTVSSLIEALKEERKQLGEYKKNEFQHHKCSEVRVRGMLLNPISHVQQWRPCGHGLSPGQMKNHHVCSNRIPKKGKEVTNSTLHSEDPSPTLPQEAEVFKVGRSTGHTTGKWSGVKHTKISRCVVDSKEIIEVTFERTDCGLRMDEPFSAPGDSGALVFMCDGQVVGMVVGGIKKESISYVTPIYDLFCDIKEWGGFHDIRVMQTSGAEEDGEEN